MYFCPGDLKSVSVACNFNILSDSVVPKMVFCDGKNVVFIELYILMNLGFNIAVVISLGINELSHSVYGRFVEHVICCSLIYAACSEH